MRKFLTGFALSAFVAGFAAPTFAADKPARDPEALFKKLDADSDGSLTETEFVGKKTDEAADKAKKAFAVLDKDKDGKVTLEEFKAGGKKPK